MKRIAPLPYLTWRFGVNLILVIALLVLFGVLVWSQEYVFALVWLVLSVSAIWVYGVKSGQAYRMLFPALALIACFALLPLLFTVFISTTNYSSSHLRSLNSTVEQLLQRTFIGEHRYQYQLLVDGDIFRLKLRYEDRTYLSQSFAMKAAPSESLRLAAGGANLFLPEAELEQQVLFRQMYGDLPLQLPSGSVLTRIDFKHYAQVLPKYRLLDQGLMLSNGQLVNDAVTLFDNQTAHYLRPNLQTGFFQAIDGEGKFIGPQVNPGFVVWQGGEQYQTIFAQQSLWLPLLRVLFWTLLFAVVSLLGSFMLGLLLAQLTLLQRGWKGFAYRLVLLLPWAIPSFITILSFKVLLMPESGELAILLNHLVHFAPDWLNQPSSARLVLLGISIWLGYPYVMLLALACLRRLPNDYYESAALSGYGPVRRFYYLTIPLTFKPLKPVLLALFAFNLHNFSLVYLFNQGMPVMADALPLAGHTQLLLNYVYSIGFSEQQNFALASAITTFGLCLLGAIAYGAWRWLGKDPAWGSQAYE
ncbi:ABC transporter permease subunit [Motilimonas eburnea]|uniref:ABC transporter permease subunit n=1 Tax=Motilimonas eburnea TaxID=1737488 RepID=UPI001E58DB92|nr:ABC transporter permease subunit [Motilimonas eburnea]MCE2572479.1 ABC transporter permease subunit [Motilimonas eburnea]